MNDYQVTPGQAAIICGHAAKELAPIMRALRDVPEESADSGWQFLCGAIEEDFSEAQVWSIEEVLELAPDFLDFINLPPGTSLFRSIQSGPWIEDCSEE
ncbi:MAG: DUF2185 domain-containing protein [Burkholderiales bacterium]|jgi:hypothetical protein